MSTLVTGSHGSIGARVVTLETFERLLRAGRLDAWKLP
jgi:hypothetical protein